MNFKNHFNELFGLLSTEESNKRRVKSKQPLTKAQQKARNKSKRARKSRRKNR